MKNGKKVYVCNLRCFSSSDVTEIRKHLFNNVLQSKVSKERESKEKVSSNNTEYVEEKNIKENTETNIEPIKKDWRDDYDEDGNYIDEESSTDTEEADNEE